MNMVPRSAAVGMPSVRAVWEFIRKQEKRLGNKELLALFSDEVKAQPIAAPFYDFVV